MVQHFTDLTLPAHDPNFPKPRGLIPVPPEVAEQVADEEVNLTQKVRRSVPCGVTATVAGSVDAHLLL
jgi:hypothetical protein